MTKTVFIAASLAILAAILIGSLASARIAIQLAQHGVRVAMNAGATQTDAAPGAPVRTSAVRICFRATNELSALYTRQCH